ncbi:uncharacterized protein B0I36DRAFT_385233 [Microdochium trichocladiopsis]|uniref:Uncharacterized protein n=1 Tax=Microdochium trichocladiopsis TaxID=1682393 RepID=A0A9P9BTJ0_9PEZI|nr:uncharacterized protein B0I36DRAFT_385233 [Microdochium trichocladiopsis]KAH7029906.1 hypothetical protein B0I36DRAFT_385233 [Microdochium trichocladiopsis]
MADINNHPDERQHTVAAPEPSRYQGVIRRDLFERLEWPLWEPISSVRVLDLPLGPGGTPAWVPLFNGDTSEGVHPLGLQPATNPPLSRLRVHLETITYHDWWQDAEMLDHIPKPLVMENTPDQGPITLAQFVREVVAYAESPAMLRAREALWFPQRSHKDRLFYADCYEEKEVNVNGLSEGEWWLIGITDIAGFTEETWSKELEEQARRVQSSRGD